MGWRSGRDQQDLVQVESFPDLYGSPEMTQMNGVESATQKA
jgi:hypothetical protein